MCLNLIARNIRSKSLLNCISSQMILVFLGLLSTYFKYVATDVGFCNNFKEETVNNQFKIYKYIMLKYVFHVKLSNLFQLGIVSFRYLLWYMIVFHSKHYIISYTSNCTKTSINKHIKCIYWKSSSFYHKKERNEKQTLSRTKTVALNVLEESNFIVTGQQRMLTHPWHLILPPV